jgi:hypothetical protein
MLDMDSHGDAEKQLFRWSLDVALDFAIVENAMSCRPPNTGRPLNTGRPMAVRLTNAPRTVRGSRTEEFGTAVCG